MRHRLQWFIHLQTQWLEEGRWTPHIHSSREYGTLYLYITCFSVISKKCPGQPGLSYCRTVCSSVPVYWEPGFTGWDVTYVVHAVRSWWWWLAFLTECVKAFTESRWNKPLRETAENMEAAIRDAEKMVWREQGQKYLYQAKRVRIYTCLLFVLCIPSTPAYYDCSFSSVFTDDGEEGGSADNTTEENSSIFSVIWMC